MAIDISVETMILTPVLSPELAVQSTARLDDIVIKPNSCQYIEHRSDFSLFYSVNHCTALPYRDSLTDNTGFELFADKGFFVSLSAICFIDFNSREFQHNS
jgi:hypothetical protein